MTARERVAKTGRVLSTIAVWRSLLLGAASGLVLLALAWPLVIASSAGRTGVIIAAGAAAAVATWLVYRRLRGPGFTVESVALWIEERTPSLGYRLVTAIEKGAPSALERSVTGEDWSPRLREAARKALVAPGVAVLAAIALVVVSNALAPAVSRLAGRMAAGPVPSIGQQDVTVRVTPPSYTRRRAESLRNPPVIRALVGSELRVSVSGRDSVVLTAGAERLRDSTFRVGALPLALRVQSGNSSRLIAIDPLADSVPVVQLRDPARDTVLATPAGTFALGADVRDDLGVGRAVFEYIVSSGSGEAFTFSSGTIGARQLDGASSGSISGRLSIPGLNLKPGDFVHVRAVATDLRGDTASARGASETRTIRIARTGEFDSVSVEAAAPPEADKAVLSQRMLINLTEALVRRRRSLSREAFGDEARVIGRDQSRLRKQVGDLVFSRLGDDPSGEHFHGDGHQHENQELRPALTPDELLKAAENASIAAAGKVLDFEGAETPVVAVNRPLLEAYNFMWDAGRELDQAAPERALPPMYRALEAIQRARAAERLYLRSRPPRAVVDVDRVRLQGKEKGTPAAREPLSPATGVARVALARFARLVSIARSDAAAAADSLLLLRMDLLASLPPARRHRGRRRGGRPAQRSRRLGAPCRLPTRTRPRGRIERLHLPLERRAMSEFVFATAQYESGDWDSAPLVPANIIDSIARYTAMPVAPTGVVVSLSSADALRYPFLFLTGHLPVRFTEAERAGIRRFIDRGGFLFIDDHNHDIDGAFHKTVTEEIERAAGPLVNLPGRHDLYKSFFAFPDGPPNTSHELNGWGDNLLHKELKAVMRGDRIAVLYSNKDYSSEWSYHPENKRFYSVDNTRFGVNIVVYALTR